jgi:hypothetical protein
LVPVDARPLLVALAELLPGGTEDGHGKPTLQSSLSGLVGGETNREHPPSDPGDQDVEDGVEAVAIAFGFATVALPDDGGEQRLEQSPNVLREVTRKVSQLHRGYPLGYVRTDNAS